MDDNEPKETESPPQKVRILLIEDDPDDAELLKGLLEELDCASRIEHEGLLTVALRRLESEKFDLVFLDLSLPDSWGMDTLRRLRKPFPGLPIVLMTGARMAEIAEESQREGATACLFKQEMDVSRLAGILTMITDCLDH